MVSDIESQLESEGFENITPDNLDATLETFGDSNN
jgi:hypothetical protein